MATLHRWALQTAFQPVLRVWPRAHRNPDKRTLKMKRLFLLTTAALIALAAPGVANAAIQNLAISGNLDGHAYTGTVSRRERRAGCQRHGNAQHPRAE